jgi:hypothetical protein
MREVEKSVPISFQRKKMRKKEKKKKERLVRKRVSKVFKKS